VHSYSIFWKDDESVVAGKNLQELKSSAIEGFEGLANAGEFTLSLDTGDKTLKITTENIFVNIMNKFPYEDKHKLIVNLKE